MKLINLGSAHFGQRLALVLAGLLVIIVCGGSASAQTGLNQRVLVVYNQNDASSISVANHYASARNVPSANMCGVAPASTTTLTTAQYDNSLKLAIQDCLNAVGPSNILYIVMSYQMPYLYSSSGHTYSLDSYIADIFNEYGAGDYYPPALEQPYFRQAQSQGNVYAPFQSFAAYRDSPGSLLIYSVWRLDGPTSTIANSLVDKAKTAEQQGLVGQYCLDTATSSFTNFPDYGQAGGSDQWDLNKSALLAQTAGFPVLEDFNTAEFGVAPATTCPGAAFFAGGFNMNKYYNGYTWNTGAFGIHMDSASATNIRSGTAWTANALLNGLTSASGVVSEPFRAGVMHPDGMLRNLFEGANLGDAVLRNTALLRWVNINIGDPLYRPFPNGIAPFSDPNLGEDKLQLSPKDLVGGQSTTATIYLANAAPAGGAVINLTANKTGLISFPSSVTVPAGESSVSFTITTNVVTVPTTVIITGTGDANVANTVGLLPMLSSITLPVKAIGGLDGQGSVFLNAPAPAGGLQIPLTSSNPGVLVAPANVFVPEGATTQTFDFQTSEVTANTLVYVTGSFAGATYKPGVTLTPALQSITVPYSSLPGGKTVAMKVVLGAPAPSPSITISVASSNPASANVASPDLVIPAGAIAGYVNVSTFPVDEDSTALLSATYGSQTITTSLMTLATSIASFGVTASVGGGNNASGTVVLSAVAPTGGVIVSLESSNPQVASVPQTVTVPEGKTSASFTIGTVAVQTTTSAQITASVNGSSKSATINVLAPSLTSLYVPASSPGGKTVSGSVGITSRAYAGGVTVTLTSSNSNVASVPQSVTIPQGATSTSFSIVLPAASSTTAVTITATFNGISKQSTLTVQSATLNTLSVRSSIAGGQIFSGSVSLTAPAPVGGLSVQLQSTNPSVASVPATATVAAGATTASFNISTSVVSSSATVTISASYGGVTKSANLTVLPPSLSKVTMISSVPGGKQLTATVGLTGPAYAGGATVALTSSNPGIASVPATVLVPEGATTATFVVNTSTVTTSTSVVISGTLAGVTQSFTLTVLPPALSSFAVTSSIKGGNAAAGAVYLTGPAYAGGVAVSIAADNSAVQVPASVVVPEGTTSLRFTINTSAVTTSTIVHVSATLNGITKSATMTVSP